MRMINKLLAGFGLQLVNRTDVDTTASINEANLEALRGTINDLQREAAELRERNRELLKRVARHTAGVHYYKKRYRLLKGGGQ